MIAGSGEKGDEVRREVVKAHVSTTCVPCVLVIFRVRPEEREMARPWRAGMRVGAIVRSLLEILIKLQIEEELKQEEKCVLNTQFKGYVSKQLSG